MKIHLSQKTEHCGPLIRLLRRAAHDHLHSVKQVTMMASLTTERTKRRHKFFSVIAAIVATCAVVIVFVAGKLGVNPACSAPTAKWVPGSLALFLIIISAPGWAGLMLQDMLSVARLFGFSDTLSLTTFYVSQFVVYYVVTLAFVMLFRKIRNRMNATPNMGIH